MLFKYLINKYLNITNKIINDQYLLVGIYFFLRFLEQIISNI